MRLNNLLAEFSHCDSSTLSTLFKDLMQRRKKNHEFG